MTDQRLIGVALVFVAIWLEAVGQIALKKAANGDNEGGLNERAVFLAAGTAFFILEIAAWTYVLRFLDVCIAFPMGSLSFVAVAILARVWLKEMISRRKWAGIGLIVGGTALLSVV